MKLLDRLSKGGAHPLAAARSFSVWGKPGAQKFLNESKYELGIRSILNLSNQISANFLFFLVGQFNLVLKNTPILKEELDKVVADLNTTFGIKYVTI